MKYIRIILKQKTVYRDKKEYQESLKAVERIRKEEVRV